MTKPPKDTEMWKAAYLQAAYETDGDKMAARVATARRAITSRLGALEGSSDHHAERRQIKAAMGALMGIEGEALDWDYIKS
jgi:hypothetical protein